MSATKIHDIREIAKLFLIEGDLIRARPYGNGHINDTYLALYQQGGLLRHFIHQRVNHHVFPNPIALMENFKRVTSHIAQIMAASGVPDIDRRVLSLIPGRDGNGYAHDKDGNLWRTTPYINNTKTYSVVTSEAVAYEVGRCFGEFQMLLRDLPAHELHTTIPDFHNTRLRFNALQQALGEDCCNRARGVSDEIAFAEHRAAYVDHLLNLNTQGVIPLRITHNDTKVDNLLIDKRTGRGMCVTDLDTTMPGLALYDFGDMIRTAANSAAEDERDLSKIYLQMDIFRPLVNGYLNSAGIFLNETEIENLVFSCKLITLEIGLRFLTDYLQGDVYFKTGYPKHNLDRCRAQFKLVTSIEQQEEAMQRIVEYYSMQQPSGMPIQSRAQTR
jgi:hypothetical protein